MLLALTAVFGPPLPPLPGLWKRSGTGVNRWFVAVKPNRLEVLGVRNQCRFALKKCRSDMPEMDLCWWSACRPAQEDVKDHTQTGPPGIDKRGAMLFLSSAI